METVLRVAFFYLLLLIGLRIIGKREFSELSPFELVTLLMIPELIQQAVIREDFSITNATIAVCTLLVLVFLTSVLTHQSRRFGDIIEGVPTVLVYNGRFVPENLDRERVTPEEVYGEMRKVGLDRIEQVRWGMIESDGRLAFVPFAPEDKQLKPRSTTPH